MMDKRVTCAKNWWYSQSALCGQKLKYNEQGKS